MMLCSISRLSERVTVYSFEVYDEVQSLEQNDRFNYLIICMLYLIFVTYLRYNAYAHV